MNAVLLPGERISLNLRGLYQSFGYRQYRVGKFEEYDLYVQNRNFLSDDRILTFSDINGQILALKPDVTLSIIKNTRDDDRLHKVWYTENVYRVPRGGNGFREILQTGLECIGRVDLYTMGEVVMLAARSLEAISPECVLDLSHMGILTGLFHALDVPAALTGAILAAVRSAGGAMDALVYVNETDAPDSWCSMPSRAASADRPPLPRPRKSSATC